ncbi:hypothetical protein [Vallitalea sp.]|jgi:uncharacterized membrane protein YccC|uniref:hypothetical protein n=1 Tax=Vallitalea sp. TaxID=1882829 RepID=UPI0025EE7DD1|nr:hypothetical protein [Vallitalea sp.]MCT4688163.1 hypothetical protein [Vallitalea sp.]
MSKKFAPIFITVLLCLINALMLYGFSFKAIISDVLIVKIIGVIFAIGIIWVIIALIVNLIRRLDELKEENEDDLSKY